MVRALTILLAVFSCLNATGQAKPDDKPRGFRVHAIDQDALDAIDDFERYCKRKDWAKAFRSLEELFASPPAGLAEGENGFHTPWKENLLAQLTGLPPAARDAFRLFNDQKAAKKLKAIEPLDISALSTFVDQYFVSSVGDNAADRLAEAHFEQGAFGRAAYWWGQIIDHHGDSDLDVASLMTRRALAAALAEQPDILVTAKRQLQERHPNADVVIGGKTVKAADVVKGLDAGDARPMAEAATPDDFQLPKDAAPHWQFKILDAATHRKVSTSRNTNMGWGNQGASSQLQRAFAVTAVDSGRVYVNWLGYCFALDQETGKLLWRSNTLSKILPNQMHYLRYRVSAGSYAVHPAGDRVFFTGIAIDANSNYQPSTIAACLDAKTGKLLWRSDKVASLTGRAFVGRGLVQDDTIYLTNRKSNNNELLLSAVDLKNGTELWQLSLGMREQSNRNYWSRTTVQPQPLIEAHGNGLLVLTNDGALLRVNPRDRAVEWACMYDPPITKTSNHDWYGNPTALPAYTLRPPLHVNGSLLIKESYSSQMLSIDPDQRKITWQRPVGRSDTIIDIDDEMMYVLGADIYAIDAKTRKMKWSNRLAGQADNMRVLSTKTRLYVFGGRGVYEISKENGDIERIFRGADLESVGGQVIVVDNLLITISNLAITAYKL
jgi:outer membrane protein assembly factor BamB